MLNILLVVLAVVLGFLCARRFPRQRPRFSRIGQAAGAALIILGCFTNGSSDAPIWTNSPLWFAAIATPCAVGLIFSMLGARLLRLTNPEAVAVAIECSYQNTGFALTIALSVFPPEKVGAASGVPLFYGVCEVVLIPIFALCAWKAGWTYAPPTEPLCTMLLNDYQPTEASAITALAEQGPTDTRTVHVQIQSTTSLTDFNGQLGADRDAGSTNGSAKWKLPLC